MTLGTALRSDEVLIARDTADSYASPTWSQLTTIKAKDYEKTREALQMMMDGSTYIGNRGGKIEAKLNLKGQFRTGDTDREALAAAQAAGVATEITIGVFYGPIASAGTKYDKVSMIVTSYKETGGENGIYEVEIEMVLGDAVTNVPSLAQTVSGS